MSEARIDSLSNESNTGGPTLSGITTFSGTNYFVPPVGNTEQRPENPEKGSIRFNTDSKHLEYFKGDAIGGWVEVEASNDELDGGNRGVAGGGWTPGVVATIKYYTISTLGSEQSFGDLTRAGRNHGACASRTRGVFGGTFPQAYQATIDYITFSQPGNAIDFGDLTLGSVVDDNTVAAAGDTSDLDRSGPSVRPLLLPLPEPLPLPGRLRFGKRMTLDF